MSALDQLTALTDHLPEAPGVPDLEQVATAVRAAAAEGATPDDIAAAGRLSVRHVLRLLAAP